jgi:hypothetical protein
MMRDPRATCLTAPLLLAGLFALGACRESGGEGEYFETAGKLFVFNYRVATATYLVNLKPLKPVGDGESVVATFENPAGGEPIVVRQKIWPRMDKTTIESPPLRCVVKNRPYAVTIEIMGPDGTVMQTIKTTMISSEDQAILPDRPLVVGPVYTPNPELAGRPGGKLDVTNEAGCPAPG